MATLIYQDVTQEFEVFTGKTTNLIKIDLIFSDGDSESIWAAISDKDKKDYKLNKKDTNTFRVAKLANVPLFLRVGWGTFIPYKLNGNSRPTCIIKDIGNCKPVQDINDLEE